MGYCHIKCRNIGLPIQCYHRVCIYECIGLDVTQFLIHYNHSLFDYYNHYNHYNYHNTNGSLFVLDHSECCSRHGAKDKHTMMREALVVPIPGYCHTANPAAFSGRSKDLKETEG